MSNYNLSEFADRVGLSQKSVRRYIDKGQTRDGVKWRKPPKIKGRFVFTDSDLALWKVDSVQSIEMSKRKVDKDAVYLRFIDIIERQQRELQELKALKAHNESIENDFEKLKEDFHRVQTEKKELEAKLNKRSWFARLFNRQ